MSQLSKNGQELENDCKQTKIQIQSICHIKFFLCCSREQIQKSYFIKHVENSDNISNPVVTLN